MTQIEITTADFVQRLYLHLLDRKPSDVEAQHWVDAVDGGLTDRQLLLKFVNSREYLERTRVRPGHPPGHFYSPIVDPAAVEQFWRESVQLSADKISGIHFELDAMTQFWIKNEASVRNAPFTEEPGGQSRYYYRDGRYPNGDAIMLMCMMNTTRPKRIIEIGSGFSSVAMLDIADYIGLTDFHLTCIDPFATRLRSLLRVGDHDRVEVVEQQVQTVSVDFFSKLDAGDILFIDSSHVLKTGSDVHYELFQILPSLKPGVLIHFHDIQFPFEYPAQWVFSKRWSWNEIYALRAFLMYNDHFKIKMFTDYFIRERRELMAQAFPGKLPLVGGSIWLERCAV